MEDLKDIKLEDVGYERDSSDYGCISNCSSSKKGKKEISYPSAYFNNKQFPKILDYNVGDEILLIAKAKITSKSINERDGKVTGNVDIEIMEAGCKLVKANDKKTSKDVKDNIVKKLKT